jgi:hypothetical protein
MAHLHCRHHWSFQAARREANPHAVAIIDEAERAFVKDQQQANCFTSVVPAGGYIHEPAVGVAVEWGHPVREEEGGEEEGEKSQCRSHI